MGRFKGLAGALALLVMAAGTVRAEERVVSRAELRADVAAMQGVVAGCAAAAGGCDAGKVVADEKVNDGAGFAVHWDWLRAALRVAKDPAKATKAGETVPERGALMREAAGHLEVLARECDGGAASAQDFGRAHDVAADVLRGAEFQREAVGPTWWERLEAKLLQWIGKIFDGFDRLGTAAPWLGRLMEWLLFGGAAVVVLVLVFRNMQRARLRVAAGAGAVEAAVWDREASDWAERADALAAEAQWREAVRCLYWAAIVLLEARRAWRHNPTRTPREYVRLLKPESARQRALRGLTQVFERAWYGLRGADAAEYARAREMYEALVADAGDGVATAGAVTVGAA